MKWRVNDNCQCGKDHSKNDFHNATIQKPGMSQKQFKDRIAEICEQLYQVGIFIKDKKNIQISHLDGTQEHGYGLNEKFLIKLLEHYEIQEQIEYFDKQRGVELNDFGGLDRDTYIMGITINDFVKLSPKDCDVCRNIVLKKRGDKDVNDFFTNHMEEKHPDLFKAQQELGNYMKEWIIVIRDYMEFTNKQIHKDWRSK